MYKTIITGTDGSPTAALAVQAAVELAAAQNATLHIVSVMAPLNASVLAQGAVPSSWFDLQRSACESLLADGERTAVAAGAKVETHAIEGDPAATLIAVAEQHDADLIVVGNRGMKGLGRFVLGSVPNRVAHHATCSVLIVHTV